MSSFKPSLDRLAAKIRDLRHDLGTVTDISVLLRMSDADKAGILPTFTDGEILLLQQAIEHNTFTTLAGLPVARDGRKILAFVRAVRDAQRVAFARENARHDEATHAAYTRYATMLIVKMGEKEAAQEMKALGKACVEDGTNEGETVAAFVAAFRDAKKHFNEHLENMWADLIELHGVREAVELFRGAWKPVPENVEAVNAAFKCAYLKKIERLTK
jgi:hypothetical protein